MNSTFSDLPMSFLGINELSAIYSELDELITVIKKETGLDCISKCRTCCNTSSRNIEVSVLEFLPLAVHLWQTNKAEEMLARLYEKRDEDHCILLENNSLQKPEGGCLYYDWRPLLCRLFGFSAMLNKEGTPESSVCRLVKQIHPERVECLRESVRNGLAIPINSQFGQRVSGADPYLGQEHYSINLALKKAIEFVGLRWDMVENNFDKPA